MLVTAFLVSGGGGNETVATTDNYAKISANTTVASQETCNNNQVVQVGEISIVADTIECNTINFGNVGAVTNQVCRQYQDIAVLSKVVADQSAKSDASIQALAGFFNDATANANNYVDIQNNIAVFMAANCTNAQKVNIQNRSFKAGKISGQDCNIFNTFISQEAMCLQNLKADISNDTSVKQDANAVAEVGVDLGQVMLFLLLIFFGASIFFVFIAIIGRLLKSGNSGGLRDALNSGANGLFGSGGASVSELKAKLVELQTSIAARQGAIAQRAAMMRA